MRVQQVHPVDGEYAVIRLVKLQHVTAVPWSLSDSLINGEGTTRCVCPNESRVALLLALINKTDYSKRYINQNGHIHTEQIH